MIQRDRVTLFAGVPTMYFAILHFEGAGRYDVSSVRHCMTGGSAMPVEVLRAFEAKYGVVILEGFGLSETSPVASFNMLEGGAETRGWNRDPVSPVGRRGRLDARLRGGWVVEATDDTPPYWRRRRSAFVPRTGTRW